MKMIKKLVTMMNKRMLLITILLAINLGIAILLFTGYIG